MFITVNLKIEQIMLLLTQTKNVILQIIAYIIEGLAFLARLDANVSYRNSKLLPRKSEKKTPGNKMLCSFASNKRYKYSVTAPTCAFSHHVGQSKGGGPSLLILAAILLLHVKAACWVNVALECWEMKSCHYLHIAPCSTTAFVK